jgi:hypothetical protein
MGGEEKVGLESSSEGDSRCDRGSLHQMQKEVAIMHETATC